MKQLDSGAPPSCQDLAAYSSRLSSVSSLLASLFYHGYWQVQADIPIAWQHQLYETFSVPKVLTINQGVRLTLICPINPVTQALTRPESHTHPCCRLLGSVPFELRGLKMNEGISPKGKWGYFQRKKEQLWERPLFS